MTVLMFELLSKKVRNFPVRSLQALIEQMADGLIYPHFQTYWAQFIAIVCN